MIYRIDHCWKEVVFYILASLQHSHLFYNSFLSILRSTLTATGRFQYSQVMLKVGHHEKNGVL